MENLLDIKRKLENRSS